MKINLMNVQWGYSIAAGSCSLQGAPAWRLQPLCPGVTCGVGEAFHMPQALSS